MGESLSQDDVLGVTVVLVTCSFREREFVRVGYYVNNEYTGEGYNAENGPPPKPLDLTLVTRQILADKPRVTKFPIPWGDNTNENDQAENDMEVNGDENVDGLEGNGVVSPARRQLEEKKPWRQPYRPSNAHVTIYLMWGM